MRINEKHGLLMAGFNGFKIYTSYEKTLRVVFKRKFLDCLENTKQYQATIDLVNLRYLPVDQAETIKNNFLNELNILKESK